MIATAANSDCRQRLATVQTKVHEQALDVYLVLSPENIFDLTGVVSHPVDRPLLLLVLADGLPRFLVPLLEAEHVGQAANLRQVRTLFRVPGAAGQGLGRPPPRHAGNGGERGF